MSKRRTHAFKLHRYGFGSWWAMCCLPMTSNDVPSESPECLSCQRAFKRVKESNRGTRTQLWDE